MGQIDLFFFMPKIIRMLSKDHVPTVNIVKLNF